MNGSVFQRSWLLGITASAIETNLQNLINIDKNMPWCNVPRYHLIRIPFIFPSILSW